ncbi:MAG: efflux RND transporter periplasmic adaptor subunit [Acidobacteria bacterium]|nr:efflux RND transporter periplasmic adaptor subunit [Acidobacteriota bacterium]
MSRVSSRVVVTLGALAAACGGAGGNAAQGQGAPPPAGVKVLTLQPRPIEQTSEFIATVRSLRSTTIQPQVEGIITAVLVKSGDRVRVGQPLVQIDGDRQQAAVRSVESSRAAREADVAFARQQSQRMETLFKAGAVSEQEHEQAQTALKNAEAQLSALDAQVREGRVQLQYFRVSAPMAGIVGDIAIRVGDRVTNSTVITTIDQQGGLELDIPVPLERAPDLKPGLAVQILDASGQVVATNPISFVSPRVEESTQSVLAKSLLREVPAGVRVQQYVRARVVWRSAPGLTIPIVAVQRVSGQYFCFVAESQGESLVARQRSVRVGEVLGDDYVIADGLKAGDRVIVSGVQKIGDGAPVKVEL